MGVASIERFVNAPKGYHPTDVMPTAKSVISLGMVLPKDILEQDIRKHPIKYTLYFHKIENSISTLVKS